MGKAKVRKKISGYEKQLEKHIEKFKEAEERGDVGAMNYFGRELQDFLKHKEKLKGQLDPKKRKKG
ncbi:MAG: hypothetical protein QF824_06080 [Candidatus Woesearchaeota archaeon]|jgi:hypothetical protein|nr:hypothetical protein [Candidatus Woesearchaeota archaeon]MDP7458147.1 hypothetical protein [Candidatus Woesearchaeota archaeon]|tara:strand:- start:1021 stop:1218 length:198 start_codon:yes stop_codon:yes gene_type:complete